MRRGFALIELQVVIAKIGCCSHGCCPSFSLPVKRDGGIHFIQYSLCIALWSALRRRNGEEIVSNDAF